MKKEKPSPLYPYYFTFSSAAGDKAIHIFWGRQSPFNGVQEQMKRELGQDCTYKVQEHTEIADQKFD